MADDVSIEITGLSEIAAQLDELPPRIARSAVRPALSAAGQVFEAALHETVPRDTGELDEAIARKVRASANLLDLSVMVGPQYEGGHKFTSTDPGVRGKFLEFGTRKMAPRFWMRRAFEISKDAAYEAAVAVLKGIMEKLPK